MPRRSYVDKNSLVINRFETGYLGKYSCIVSNDYGRTVKTIQFFEEYPGILGFKVDQEQLREPSLKRLRNRHFRVLIGSDRPRLGDTIVVECLNLGPDSQVGPKWRRRLGETLKSYDLPHILVIRRIGLSDVGEYICETGDEQGRPGEAGMRVSIDQDGLVELEDLLDEVARIRIVLSNKLDLARGVRLELTCLSTGQMAWYKVIGESLLRLVSREVSFVRSPVKEEDLGRYRCIVDGRAYREVVVARQEARLGMVYAYVGEMKRVVGETAVVSLRSRQGVVFKAAGVGDDVMLRCPVSGGEVKWLRGEGDGVVRGVGKRDFGEYRCVAGPGLESKVVLVKSEEVPLFGGRSFLAFNASRVVESFVRNGLRVQVTFKSFRKDGLILRLGDERTPGVFMSLELVDSVIKYG